MKKICTLSIMLYTLCSFSQQKLEGLYCISYTTGDFVECLEFIGNEFSYEEGGHLGTESYGSGTFEQSDKYLILNYNLTKPSELSYHKLKFWINENPNIELKISVKDLEGNLVKGANIYVPALKVGVTADGLGYGQLEIEKKNQNFELLVSYLGYVEERIQLRQDHNYEIEVFLRGGTMPAPILNQIDTLKIIQNKKGSFEEILENSRVRSWNKRLQED